MPRGRKPSSTNLKLLKGERAARIPAAPAPSAAGRPVCPGRYDDRVRLRWAELCDTLAARGILDASHGYALEVYAGAYSRFLKAEEAIETHGLTITSGSAIKANPAINAAAQAEAMMLRVALEFGLTAVSSSKVSARVEEESPLDQFLTRKTS